MPESQSALERAPRPDGEIPTAGARLEIDRNTVRVEPLNDLHQRRGFCCSDRGIQNFCRMGIDRHHRQNIIRAFVARCEPDPEVYGFYYLTTTSFEHEEVGRAVGDRFHLLDKVPAVYLGMLGVHTPADRQGIGTQLMFDAFERVLNIAANAGVWALTLDAVDEEAVTYYQRFDFERLAPNSLEMFLPLGTIAALFEDPIEA